MEHQKRTNHPYRSSSSSNSNNNNRNDNENQSQMMRKSQDNNHVDSNNATATVRTGGSSRVQKVGYGPLKSVEGWVLFVTGVHEEAQEDDVMDAFSECGTVNKVQVNCDRRTGFVKGYAIVEYQLQSEAQDAINKLHGTELLGKTIGVHWAFATSNSAGGGGGRRTSGNRQMR